MLAMSARMNSGADISELLESLKLSGNNGSSNEMDQLAEHLKSNLGLNHWGEGEYVKLAEAMAGISLSRAPANETSRSESSRRNADASSSGSAQPPSRGRSPTARPAIPRNLRSTSTPVTHDRYDTYGYMPPGNRNQDSGKKRSSPEEKKEAESYRCSSQYGYSARGRTAESSSPPRAVNRLGSSTSPVRQGVTSRPTTPVRQHHHSRSISPHSARPGLQEDGNDDCASLSGRSPGRANSSGVSVSGSVPNVPISISGISSQHPSGVPTSRHHRSRSAGVDLDADSIAKPDKPRTLSRSPMRRPASDDDGDRPPAPPRSFSKSPQDHGTSFVSFGNGTTDNIQMPDLSMPDFCSNTNPDTTEGLFTPPPRESSTASARSVATDYSAMSIASPFTPFPTNESSSKLEPRPTMFPDTAEPPSFSIGVKRESRKTRVGKGKVATNPSHGSSSPMDIDDSDRSANLCDETPKFSIGTSFRPRRRANPGAHSADARATLPPKDVTKPPPVPLAQSAQHHNLNFGPQIALINSKREEAKAYYIANDYPSSIHAYCKAIQAYQEASEVLKPDTLALLLSNRAACLLMVGAYEAAVENCRNGIKCVNDVNPGEPFSNDSGILLRIKLHTRLGRGLLKLGDYVQADSAFQEAVNLCETAARWAVEIQLPENYEKNSLMINQLRAETGLGRNDALRLKTACDGLSQTQRLLSTSIDTRGKLAEALGQTNIALSIASGSADLTEAKVSILVRMKRWREVAGFCERLGAFNVTLDGVFVDDLAALNPFPGIPPAQHLKADFFSSNRDEDIATREMKLSTRCTSEAVLRLPTALQKTYIRALRLEERYPAADASLKALEDLVRRRAGIDGFPIDAYAFLGAEKTKLHRTKSGREEGDEFFRNQDFEKAAEKYEECLGIDSIGEPMIEDSNAGGRLHAVLHCNRAACLMALRRFNFAVQECTSALKIHTRYMKAILRRARCYSRLNRKLEAICEYQRWIDLVEDPNSAEASNTSPCLFDGPRDVKQSEVATVRSEMEECRKAKRRNDAKAQEETNRRRANAQRDFFQENYAESWRSSSGASASARDRRDQWQAQQNSSRRWDSFNKRGPRSSSNPRPRFTEHPTGRRSNSQGRPRSESLVSPRSNGGDHYAILEVSRSASTDDIKKAYHKLALKYHPDKNKDVGAVENFRRVKLARDVLSDPVKRSQYDSEQGYRRHF